MTASDFFFISAGVSILVVLLTWIFIAFKIIRLINKAEIEIMSVKNSLRLSGLNLISKIINISKGGDK